MSMHKFLLKKISGNLVASFFEMAQAEIARSKKPG
jgi:hypothetical protein